MKNLNRLSALTFGLFLVAVASTSTADTVAPMTSFEAGVYESFGFDDAVTPLQEAKQAAAADVVVLFASNAGKGIDDCAKELKALTQPPLSSYDSYSCLSEKQLPLRLKTLASMPTPDQGKLTLTLNAVVKRDGKKPKYDVDVQVDKADGDKFVSTNVKAPEGKYFFLAGPKFEKDGVEGILVFAIQLKAP